MYELVASDDYKQPWFHDIENLTINHDGYVLWHGQEVEHYTLNWAYSDEARQDAQELAERCLHLESLGIQPTTTTVIWHWEKYAGQQAS